MSEKDLDFGKVLTNEIVEIFYDSVDWEGGCSQSKPLWDAIEKIDPELIESCKQDGYDQRDLFYEFRRVLEGLGTTEYPNPDGAQALIEIIKNAYDELHALSIKTGRPIKVPSFEDSYIYGEHSAYNEVYPWLPSTC